MRACKPLDFSYVGDMLGSYAESAPSANADAKVGAIDDIILGAIIGAVVGAGVANHADDKTPSQKCDFWSRTSQPSDVTRQLVTSRIHLLEPIKKSNNTVETPQRLDRLDLQPPQQTATRTPQRQDPCARPLPQPCESQVLMRHMEMIRQTCSFAVQTKIDKGAPLNRR